MSKRHTRLLRQQVTWPRIIDSIDRNHEKKYGCKNPWSGTYRLEFDETPPDAVTLHIQSVMRRWSSGRHNPFAGLDGLMPTNDPRSRKVADDTLDAIAVSSGLPPGTRGASRLSDPSILPYQLLVKKRSKCQMKSPL